MTDTHRSHATPLATETVLDRALAAGSATPRICIVTGGRGAGKSAWCGALAREARARGLQVAGLWSPAALTEGEKTGIDLVDLAADETRRLAVLRTDDAAAVATGKWAFDPDVIAWGNAALAAVGAPDLLIVDELGPLEFERGQGLTQGLRLIDARSYRLACVVIRPELLAAAVERWPGSWVVTPPAWERKEG
jgi:nucleoside-triphosphatase